MIQKNSIVRRKVRSLLLRVLNSLENNGNAAFEKNGEKRFVEDLFSFFRERQGVPLVMIDVGANTGRYSQMLLDKARQENMPIELHVFEPTAQCIKGLKKRFACEAGVSVIEKAASNKTETSTIYFDAPGSSLASVYPRDLGAYAIDMRFSEEITTVRLDAYIDEKRLAHVNFMKLDVEGHELAVFEGLGKYLDGGFVDFVQFEYGGANLDSDTTLRQLFSMLEGKGFKIGKIMRRGIELRRYEAWMENYQYSNYVALSGRLLDGMR